MRMRPIPYSCEEMAWLEENRAMVISDYHRLFVQRFERQDVAAIHLHGLRKRKGWKVGRAGGRYVGRRRLYSPAEIEWLRSNSTMQPAEYYRAFCELFGRSDVTARQVLGLRKREGWLTGRTGRFEKGQISHNKGKRCDPGSGGRHPNAVKTQFKKGGRPHTYRGPGHERVDSKDGYVVMIVAEKNPWTGAATRPVHKHRWLWEQANGPLPDDQVLKCLDGDKTNTDPSNWEPVPRGVLARLNGGPHKKTIAFDDAPTELKPTVMAVAKLKHRAGELRRQKREDSDT